MDAETFNDKKMANCLHLIKWTNTALKYTSTIHIREAADYTPNKLRTIIMELVVDLTRSIVILVGKIRNQEQSHIRDYDINCLQLYFDNEFSGMGRVILYEHYKKLALKALKKLNATEKEMLKKIMKERKDDACLYYY